MTVEPAITLLRPLPANSHPLVIAAAHRWATELQGKIPTGKNALGVSIDLETPVTYGPGIFSAGLVPFDEVTGEIYMGATLYVRNNFAEVLDSGHYSGGTVRWWMEQGDAPRFELVKNQQQTMPYIEGIAEIIGYLYALSNFLQPRGMLMPLGNSARFDIGILEATACALNVVCKNVKGEKQLPWQFWDELDLRQRTLDCRMLAGMNIKDKIKRTGTHHNAVDDAIHQAKMYIGAGLCIAGKQDVLSSREASGWEA